MRRVRTKTDTPGEKNENFFTWHTGDLCGTKRPPPKNPVFSRVAALAECAYFSRSLDSESLAGIGECFLRFEHERRSSHSPISMQTKLSNLAVEEQGSEELIKQLYIELKRMARGRLAMERQGITLNTTALVHEAWIRLEKSSPERWRDRAQFFAAAAEAMRRILVEAARRRLAAKRGGGEAAIRLDDLEAGEVAENRALLGVHEVLDQLAAEDAMKAQIVKLRFFSGLENEEIAALLGVNEKTVRRHWELAKIWLYRAMTEDG